MSYQYSRTPKISFNYTTNNIHLGSSNKQTAYCNSHLSRESQLSSLDISLFSTNSTKSKRVNEIKPKPKLNLNDNSLKMTYVKSILQQKQKYHETSQKFIGGNNQNVNINTSKSLIYANRINIHKKQKNQTSFANQSNYQYQSYQLQKFSVQNSFIHNDRQNNQVNQPVKYSKISRLLGWHKFTPICGFQNKYGQKGCLCGSPCYLVKEWTKDHKQTDFKLFQQLMNHKICEKQMNQINKDILRTHSECLTFSQNKHFQQMLKQVLTCYVAYDPQIGYVQGMNLIVGVILYHMKNSQLSFWAFVDLMDEQELRMIYLPEFEYLKMHENRIMQYLGIKVNDLVQKMNELQIFAESFLNGWILSLMGTCIPLEYMHNLIDKFRRQGWLYIYKLVVTYLIFLKDSLLRTEDQAEFLVTLNTKNSREYGMIWEKLIESAGKLKLEK